MLTKAEIASKINVVCPLFCPLFFSYFFAIFLTAASLGAIDILKKWLESKQENERKGVTIIVLNNILNFEKEPEKTFSLLEDIKNQLEELNRDNTFVIKPEKKDALSNDPDQQTK